MNDVSTVPARRRPDPLGVRRAVFAAALLNPVIASAHSFAPPYTLPVPFSLYAYGAAAALLLSFLIAGVFARVPALGSVEGMRRPGGSATVVARRRLPIGATISLGLLTLCIASGLLGVQNAYANFNMTFFWIVFVLGVPYAVALLGDFYPAVNPWKALVHAVEGVTGSSFEGRVRYPGWLAYYPALLLYMAFIWLELFGSLTPRGLSLALVAYTAVNLVGAWLFGKAAWFWHGEFFGVTLRMIGKLSPWARPWEAEERALFSERRWRAPFVGLYEAHADHLSLLLFILFMLSSTAFDGLHATQAWNELFWKHLYPLLDPLFATAPGQKYAFSTKLYHVWQWVCLWISPFVYLAVFIAFLSAVKALVRTKLTVKAICLRFAFSLIPIAFVYHVTHYYTLLLMQGSQIVRLVSDPFGFGWNLFGTAKHAIKPIVVDVEVIWHTQVALILVGHIVSVYLAHLEALASFHTPRRATISQLPMLLLMVFFTTTGMWILSLPLSAGG